MPVIPDKKTDQPERTVMNLPALLTKFHGHTATAITVRIQQPLRILIHLGQSAAISIPVDTQFRTMQSASCDARKAIPEKNVPALAAGVIETDWIWRRSSNGFQKYCP
jgi:hypothetical protein